MTPLGDNHSFQGTRLTVGGVPIDFARIPKGEFLMGTDPAELDRVWASLGWPGVARSSVVDETPQHREYLSAFEMSVTEVTVKQFRAYCRATGASMPTQEVWNSTEQHPVHRVSWNDAAGYCNWATRELMRAGLNGVIRLPSEAEWEYAARGGDTGLNGRPQRLFPWGDKPPSGSQRLANGTIAGNTDGFERTAPVGMYPANGFGLRDVVGNVLEWCSDIYCDHYGKVTAPSRKPYRVLRGGSWRRGASGLRVADRFRDDPVVRGNGTGFRLVRTLPTRSDALPPAPF